MKRPYLLLTLTLGFATAVFAQESRSTVSGQVTDPTGAVVPNARVKLIDTDTGAVSNLKTNEQGYYTAAFLAPGPYRIEVDAPGFSHYVHNGVHVDTAAHLEEDVSLSVGSSTQSVTVTTAAPLLQTEDATSGQVLTTTEVENLPSNGRSPLGFARTAYGAVPKLKHATTETRPFDNSASSDFSLGGSNSQSNEILLNGVPNEENSGRVAAYSPQMDSVDQVRVDQFSANAVYGDTSGGTVNITTKSGSNDFHGALSWFNEQPSLAAQPYFSTSSSATRQNQYGISVGGPVWIPKVYNGRNKLFFFYAYERFDTTTPSTTISSVPTAAERTGDFSALLGVGSKYQLYNPYSATLNSAGQLTRQPIPDNVLSNAGLTLDPVAQAYLKYIPLPNYSGATTKADGENNYIANTPTIYAYRSSMGRLDYNVATSNHLFFEAHRSNLDQTSIGIFGPSNIASGSSSIVNMWGGTLDDVQTFSPTVALDTRVGYSRTLQSSVLPSQGFDATTLGFPATLNTSSLAPTNMPRVAFSDGASIPTLGGSPGSLNAFQMVQLFSDLTKVIGHHTLQAGVDIRENKNIQQNQSYLPGGTSYSSGSFNFTNATTSGFTTTSASSQIPQAQSWVSSGTGGTIAPFGSSLAEFMLGLPNSGEYDENLPTSNDQYYSAFFVQDNWKATQDLAINVGLRLEHETGIVESSNRVAVAFNTSAVNAVTTAAQTKYAEAPLPQLPVGSFQPTGGFSFATPGNRSSYTTYPIYTSPRFGLSYAPQFLGGKTVFRAGFGIYYNPFNDYYVGPAAGFQQATLFQATNNNSISPASTLSNPFPTSINPIQSPPGSSLGVNTDLGNAITFNNPHTFPAYSERWSFDIEHSLGQNFVLQIGYVGNHQLKMTYSNQISATPLLPFLSRLPTSDPAEKQTGGLGASVANPFHGLIPGTSLGNSSKVTAAQLLQGYPEFSSVTEQLYSGGSSNYNAIDVRLTKRLANGLEFNAVYEHSRLLGAMSQINPGGALWYGTNASDFPNHVAVTAAYELPFGRGRRFLANSNELEELLVGGWQFATIYTYESGTALSFGNVDYLGDWHDFHNKPRNITQAFNTSVFNTSPSAQPNAYNFRTFPLSILWSDGTNNVDASAIKNFYAGEGIKLQARFEAYNLANRVSFGSANTSPTSAAFGTITSQLNSGRVIQTGLRLSF